MRGAVARTPRGSESAAKNQKQEIMAKTTKSGRTTAKPVRARQGRRASPRPRRQRRKTGCGRRPRRAKVRRQPESGRAEAKTSKPKTQAENWPQSRNRASQAAQGRGQTESERCDLKPQTDGRQIELAASVQAAIARRHARSADPQGPDRARLERDAVPAQDRFPDEGGAAASASRSCSSAGSGSASTRGCAPMPRDARHSFCMTGRLTPTATSISAPGSTRS